MVISWLSCVFHIILGIVCICFGRQCQYISMMKTYILLYTLGEGAVLGVLYGIAAVVLVYVWIPCRGLFSCLCPNFEIKIPEFVKMIFFGIIFIIFAPVFCGLYAISPFITDHSNSDLGGLGLFLNFMMALYRLPCTVLLIMSVFDSKCQLIDPFTNLMISVIILDIIYYTMSLTAITNFLESNLKIRFRILFSIIALNVNCMEIINIILCVLNYYYIDKSDEIYLYIWICLTIITIPGSLSLLFSYYITKHVFIDLKDWSKKCLYEWAIFNHLYIFCGSNESIIIDKIFCIVHIARYHTNVINQKQSLSQKSKLLQPKLSINSDYTNKSEIYLSLHNNHYKMHKLDDDECIGVQLEYAINFSLKKKKNYIKNMIPSHLSSSFVMKYKCGYILLVIYFIMKIALLCFPLVWFFYYYIDDYDTLLNRFNDKRNHEHMLIQLIMSLYILSLVLYIILNLIIIPKSIRYVSLIGLLLRNHWDRKLYQTENLQILYESLGKVSIIQYLFNIGLSQDIAYLILEYMYPFNANTRKYN